MKNKITMLLLSLFAGMIIGAAIVWMLFNCCCKSSCCRHECGVKSDTTGIFQISVQTANTYFKAYLNDFESVDTLKAFSINLQQLNAMNLIAKSDPSVNGFRIYMGIDGKTPVRMVVGTGSPDKTGLIYSTNEVSSGPCPRLCDEASQIMAK
jgi:hypothetical protein